jgi:hypothetical protein
VETALEGEQAPQEIRLLELIVRTDDVRQPALH